MERFVRVSVLVLLAVGIGASAFAAGAREAPGAAAAAEMRYPPGPLFRLDPPVTMTTIKSVPPTGTVEYPEGEDAQNNVMYWIIEETIGVKVVNTITVDSAAYNDRLRLAVVSGDIPDFGNASTTIIMEMIRNDMLADLAPYMDYYASSELEEHMYFQDRALLGPVSTNGGYQGLPVTATMANYIPVLYIRKDWREALGYDLPTTMEEVFELAKAFGTQDPNNSGRNDTYGIGGFGKDLLNDVNLMAFTAIAAAFDLSPGRWVLGDDGRIVYGSLDPGMKDYLAMLQDLYRNRGIDPEFGVKDFGKANEDMAAGRFGMWVGAVWHPVAGMAAHQSANPGAEWDDIVMVPSAGVEKYVRTIPAPMLGYMFVNKDCETPEGLIAILNNHAAHNFGDTSNPFSAAWVALGEDPKYQGRTTNNWLPVSIQRIVTDEDATRRAVLANDRNLHPDVNQGGFDMVKQDVWGFVFAFMRSFPKTNYYVDNEMFRFDAYLGAPTPTQRSVGAVLEQREEEVLLNIIAGRSPVSAYDDFISEWLRLGGEQVIREVNEAAGR